MQSTKGAPTHEAPKQSGSGARRTTAWAWLGNSNKAEAQPAREDEGTIDIVVVPQDLRQCSLNQLPSCA